MCHRTSYEIYKHIALIWAHRVYARRDDFQFSPMQADFQYNARYQEGRKVRSILTMFPLRQAVEFFIFSPAIRRFPYDLYKGIDQTAPLFNAVGLA